MKMLGFPGIWLLAMLCASCTSHVPEDDWRAALWAEVMRSGDRNWIVVADSAFPIIAKKDSKTLLANAEATEVLDVVFEAMESDEHVRPRVYLAKELDHVENDLAPGVDTYIKELKRVLRGRTTVKLQNRVLRILLDDARATHRVTVIKTRTTLPYSAIYLELESGYWDQDSENRLRKAMSHSETIRD